MRQQPLALQVAVWHNEYPVGWGFPSSPLSLRTPAHHYSGRHKNIRIFLLKVPARFNWLSFSVQTPL